MIAAFTAVICHDQPGDGPARLRAALLEAHLAHVERELQRIAAAGPLRDAAGRITGSLLILHGTEADARALMARDPYISARIWRSIDYAAFNPAAGDWVGGAAWKAEA